jgi:hypothetical protein
MKKIIVAGFLPAGLPYSNMTVACRFRERLTGLVGFAAAVCGDAWGWADACGVNG